MELCNALSHTDDWIGNCPNALLLNPLVKLTNQVKTLSQAVAQTCGKPLCDGTRACTECRCPNGGTVSHRVGVSACHKQKRVGPRGAGSQRMAAPRLRACSPSGRPSGLSAHCLWVQCDAPTKFCPCDGAALTDCSKCKCPDGQVLGGTRAL